jgi:hypothetical protein
MDEKEQAQNAKPGRLLTALVILLLGVSLVSSILAVQFYNDSRDARQYIDEIDRAVRGDGPSDRGDTRPADESDDPDTAGGAYDLLPVLARKDAKIRELEQKVKALQGGEPLVRPVTMKPPPKTDTTPLPPEFEGEPVIENIAEQQEFLESMDVSWLTDEQRENHTEILARLAAIQELWERAPEVSDPDERRQLRREVRESIDGLQEMFLEERRAIFYNWGRELDYDEDTAEWFADYAEYVNDMTSVESTMRRMWSSARD